MSELDIDTAQRRLDNAYKQANAAPGLGDWTEWGSIRNQAEIIDAKIELIQALLQNGRISQAEAEGQVRELSQQKSQNMTNLARRNGVSDVSVRQMQEQDQRRLEETLEGMRQQN